MTWNKVKLGEILTESKILSVKPDPDRRITVRLKVLGVEKRGIENEIEGATKQYTRKAGQFIYGKQNFHKGAFGIIPPELDGFESSADLPAFDVADICLPEFLFYFFKQGNYYLELAKIASGVATQRINTVQLFELEIPLPNIPEQRVFLANMNQLEKNSQQISYELSLQLSLLKSLRQQLLQDAVQGKLVPQDETEGNAQELLAQIKAEKSQLIKEKKLKKEKDLSPITAEIPFEIPDNWVWCRLGEIATLITDGKHGDSINEQNSGYYFLSAKDVQNGKLVYENARQITYKDFYETHKRTNLEAGDLCIVNTGATIGKTAFALNNELTPKTTFQKSVAIVKTIKKLINMRFIEFFIINETPKLLKKSRGSAINNLLIGDLKNLLLPLPPLSEQNRIVQKLESVMQNCDALAASIKQSASENEQLLQQVLREALQAR